MSDRPILYVPLGRQDARLYGLDPMVRAFRDAEKAGLEPSRADSLSNEGGRGTVLVDLNFAYDPVWLGEVKNRPGSVLLKDGRPVMAHCTRGPERIAFERCVEEGGSFPDGLMEVIDADHARVENQVLRKRDQPFAMAYGQDNAMAAEKALYDASYKGVTDLLTLYLWRVPAFHVTRFAARMGLSPNMVTAIGFILCVGAFFAFLNGLYWTGLLAGFVFMMLDTVDGKLARCTGTSSWWGNIFDHGIDLVHPPFWYGAWIAGLGAVNLAFEPVYAQSLFWIIFAGYVLQRVIEGIFIARHKMHIHVWRPVDSRFRLITARRNPNMAILAIAMALGRPDIGIELVAAWTILSLIFHAVRLAQAEGADLRGEKIESWLS